MYEGKKVYGPYTRKDGRQIVILKTPGSNEDHQTVSYPKYIVECALGRYLDNHETVDHIDGNFLNNDLSNLRVVKRSDHARSHCKKKVSLTLICLVCGTTFNTTESNRLTCGSKTCVGKCAHILGHNTGNDFSRNKPKEYIPLRDSIEDIPSIYDILNNPLS